MYGYDERARPKIASRFASDWGKLQFADPKAVEYTTVRLETRWETSVPSVAFEPRGQVHPWFKCLVASIADGSLYSGDRIHITVGDRSGGGPGWRAQMFRERGCEWRFFVDPFGAELAIDHRETPLSGVHAYWIRVTQEDGAQAWMSPYTWEATGKAHLVRWHPRPHAQRRATTPRVRSSGAALHLDPSRRPATRFGLLLLLRVWRAWAWLPISACSRR